jgi:M6 family metalloprotease-like protein
MIEHRHAPPSVAARPIAPALSPQARAQLEQRLQRWKKFPDRVSTPRVDWSPRANRRTSWTPPAAAIRNPHLRTPARHAVGDGPGAAIAVDTIRVAILRIDFLADRTGAETSGDGKFDLTAPDTNVAPIDRPPHNRAFYLDHLEALNRYYDAQSYGRVLVEGDVWPRTPDGAYHVSDMADFGPWTFDVDIYRAAVNMMRTMLFAADSQSIAVGDRIPWDSYDRFMIIHAGSDLQSDLRGDSPRDIPSLTLGVDDTDRVVFPDSLNRPLDRCAFIPETENQDGFLAALNGVIAHESGHNFFGFADLYNFETGLPVVGLWSLMDAGNLAGKTIPFHGEDLFATGLLPPSLDPFHRFFATDALFFPDIAFGDTTELRDSERYPDIPRIWLSSDEYLLLEHRHQYRKESDPFIVDQSPTTTVILGPNTPDRYEYDQLLPGGGVLVWHIDASVIPFETAFRFNEDFGFNTNPNRLGISIIEADGLQDLGDPGSPLLLGSFFDPYFVGNNATLSDSTVPNLRPHIQTRPHTRMDVLDTLQAVMRVRAVRTWQLGGWPVAADFPPEGPQLMAIDADGDGAPEVCWAGGDIDSPDSTALFAVRSNGRGLFTPAHSFFTLDFRPRPVMAALATGAGGAGPSLFAVSTYARFDSLGAFVGGGKVWLVDHLGNVQPGWPASLPMRVSTPPVIAGTYPNASIFVGCENGEVVELALDGSLRRSSATRLARVTGRLAVRPDDSGTGWLVAAGDEEGYVAVNGYPASNPPGPWPLKLGALGFEPDFLWIDFDGEGNAPGGATRACGDPTLIVHHADRLWALCANGVPLQDGWGRPTGDTLANGLGAGDPDADGYPEVLTQGVHTGVAFWNQSGYPSPGWPKKPSRENFPTHSPPLVVDVDGDGVANVVADNASGILFALDALGRTPEGWPLATGSGAAGAPLAVDFNGDGMLEIVAPDRPLVDSLQFGINGRYESLYAYTLPVGPGSPAVTSWTMLGGDPGRSSTLPPARTPVAGAPSPGPLVPGSLKAYPNPARRKPVQFAYQLTEPAEVEFKIVDSSGHQVTSFRGTGRRADNVDVWEPGNTPAGLYLAHVKFKSGGRERQETVTVGLIR